MTTARSVTVLVLAALLSCGYSPRSAEDLAERIDCKGFEAKPPPTLVTDAGTCVSFYDQRVTILYFADNSARDEIVRGGTQAGRQYLVGNHFAVEGPNRTLGELRLVIDGDIRGADPERCASQKAGWASPCS